MKEKGRRLLRVGIRALGYGLLGGFATLVVVGIVVLEQRPDLDLWHTVELEGEFDRKSPVSDFAGYLALEESLFEELDREVYQKTGTADESSIARYQRGSMADPAGWETDWNRSFELSAANPTAGVLLLHGMSDSPYSLRHLGKALHAEGATVVGLRLPGHGTAPSGLVRTRWQDMAAATCLAVRHLREQVGERPILLVGYSNGGALAVHYALARLEDSSLPRVDGIVLVSPAIGVTPTAALAVWQGRAGRVLGLDKLAWNSILLEYDPFKYGSFAVNAGDQTHRLTGWIAGRMNTLTTGGRGAEFPPVLAFQSAVDATVSTPALITNLFSKLPEGGHELMLFDINRTAAVGHLLTEDPARRLEQLLAREDLSCTVSVVTNKHAAGKPGQEVVIRRHPPGTGPLEITETGLSWPRGTYSLSHVALPFPASDPLYGNGGEDGMTTLGNLALRGERGAIRISANDMLRQRWNPFYPLLEQRVLEFKRRAVKAAAAE